MNNKPEQPMRFHKRGDNNSRKGKDLITYLRAKRSSYGEIQVLINQLVAIRNRFYKILAGKA